MSVLSVIILSNTLDDEIYDMNCKCIESLIVSEDWNKNELRILLIESNKTNQYKYNEQIEVIVPQEKFNFNRFLNIGVEQSNSEFIALCNNDIIFRKGWFTEILKIKKQHFNFMCFSPIDRDYTTMSYELFPEDNAYYTGWKNKYHFAAWCIVLDRRIFTTIGKLDERFDFYYADDDFLMTLRKYSLDNVLVVNSHVKHLSQQVTEKVNRKTPFQISDKVKYPIPTRYLNRGFSWLWDDKRFYDAFFRMEDKWGDEKMIRRLNRFFEKFVFLQKRPITRVFYSKFTITLLAKLTRV